VCEGDVITHINDTDILQLPMADILALIKASSAPKFTLQQPELPTSEPRSVILDTTNGKSVGLLIAPHPSGGGLQLDGCVGGGQAEATGLVCKDDVITHINDTDILQLPMADILALIKASTAPKFTLQQPEGEEQYGGKVDAVESVASATSSDTEIDDLERKPRSFTLDTTGGKSVGTVRFFLADPHSRMPLRFTPRCSA
jgi:hypothetical protein